MTQPSITCRESGFRSSDPLKDASIGPWPNSRNQARTTKHLQLLTDLGTDVPVGGMQTGKICLVGVNVLEMELGLPGLLDASEGVSQPSWLPFAFFKRRVRKPLSAHTGFVARGSGPHDWYHCPGRE